MKVLDSEEGCGVRRPSLTLGTLRLEEGREGDGEAKEDLDESSGRKREGTKRAERVVWAAAMAKVDVRATPLTAVQ